MAITKWIFYPTPTATTTTAASPSTPEPIIVTTADAKQFGLENFGNTCYANSVLQALYFCGPFRDLVVQYPDPSAPDTLPAPGPLAPQVASPIVSSPRPKPTHRGSISGNVLGHPPPAIGVNTPLQPSAGIPIPASPPTLLSALRSLYVHISKNPADKGTVAPRAFIDKLKELNELFRSTMHQDAHEFLNYLLNQIVEEMDEDKRKIHGLIRGSPSREDLSLSDASLSSTAAPPAPMLTSSTLVHRLFEGVLTSETRCLTCETVSSREESFLDLSIDIEQNSSVTACLRQFSASEMLCQKNKFFCDSCCDLQEAEKRMKIKKLPNVLALHLKRFKYQEDVGRYIKLTYRVAFPMELRLFNTVDDAENPDRLYELFAIVVHIGNGPHHGHYVSIIKSRGTWYLFDDDTVSTINESEIPKYYGESNAGSAYVLYYQAVDLDATALGVRSSVSSPAVVTTSQTRSMLSTTVESNGLNGDLPTVPPGLTTTTSSLSDKDKPIITPSLIPILPTASPQITPVLQPSPPPALIIPPTTGSEPSSVSSVPPTTPNASSSRGFLGTIRKRRSVLNGNSEHRRSIIDSVVGSSTSNGSQRPESSSEPVEQLATSPSITSPLNGKKVGGKDKGPVSWFTNLRSSGKQGTTIVPLTDRSTSYGTGDTWHKDNKPLSRRASEAALPEPPAFFPSVPSTSNHHVPMLHAATMSPVLRPVPESKKSTPELSSHEKIAQTPKSYTKRPSTAGATASRPKSVAVPLPPPLFDSSAGRPSNGIHHSPSRSMSMNINGQRGEKSGPPPLSSGLAPSGANCQRPHTAHPLTSPSTLGFSTSNATMTTISTTTTAAESTGTSSSNSGLVKSKRSTRKLSFTAPMLGFGRKEKDRRPHSPATGGFLSHKEQ